MKSLFTALDTGQRALGLTALGGLFEKEKLANLNGLKIQNKDFKSALAYRLVSTFR